MNRTTSMLGVYTTVINTRFITRSGINYLQSKQ